MLLNISPTLDFEIGFHKSIIPTANTIILKGTVRVNSSDLSFKEEHYRYTRASFD